jgi:DnaJ domain
MDGLNEPDIVESKRAYHVLGLPYAASAIEIKRAYRALLRRWHPDLYVSGTQNHDDATRVAKKINEAYSRIRHAPLRYYVENSAQPPSTRAPDLGTPVTSNEPSDDDLPRLDRIEFWVRFVCGAVLGVFVSINLAWQFYFETSLRFFVVASIGITLVCAFCSARYGDKFWHSILERWWLWS